MKKFIGFHKDLSALPIRKGDKVVIPMGIKVKSLGSKGSYITKRSYTVTIRSVLWGVGREDQSPHMEIVNPELRWAGSGGYWCYADINDVLPANPELYEERMGLEG